MNLCRVTFPDVERMLVPSMLDTFFDWGNGGSRSREGRFPLDVVEKSGAFELTADAPGMEPGDISVEVEDGVLRVKGERRAQEEEKDAEGRVIRAERSRRQFERHLKLAENMDPEGISATLERGVLTVKVPKVEVTRSEPKRIDVREVQPDKKEQEE